MPATGFMTMSHRAMNGLCGFLLLQGVVNCGVRAAVAPPAGSEGKGGGFANAVPACRQLSLGYRSVHLAG